MSSLASIFSTHARRADLAPKQTCQHCQEEFTLGVNCTKDGCDECTGTERAVNGFAIDPEQCRCFEKMGDNPNCPRHGKGK